MALPIGAKMFSLMTVISVHCELEHFEELSSPTEILQSGRMIRSAITDEACFPSAFWRKESWKDFDTALNELELEIDSVSMVNSQERTSPASTKRFARIFSFFGLFQDPEHVSEAPAKRLARTVQEKSKPVHYALRDEIENMPICRIAFSHVDIEKWIDIRTSFGRSAWVYDGLPKIAQDDLQEAAWCYLFDRLTSSVMLILRATECACRAYAEQEFPGELFERWHTLILRIQRAPIGEDKEFAKWLMHMKEYRNDFMHPSKRLDETQEEKFDSVFSVCKELMIYMWKDLRQKEKV